MKNTWLQRNTRQNIHDTAMAIAHQYKFEPIGFKTLRKIDFAISKFLHGLLIRDKIQSYGCNIQGIAVGNKRIFVEYRADKWRFKLTLSTSGIEMRWLSG